MRCAGILNAHDFRLVPDSQIIANSVLLAVSFFCLLILYFCLCLLLSPTFSTQVAIDWHRRISRVGILLALIHGADMAVSKFRISALFSTAGWNSAGGASLFGTLSFVCFAVLFVLSLERYRRAAFELFWYSHLALAPLGLLFACLHSVNMRYLLIAPAALWLMDCAARFTAAHVAYPMRGVASVARAAVIAAPASSPSSSPSSSSSSSSGSSAAPSPDRVTAIKLELNWPRGASDADMDEYAGGYFWISVPELSLTQFHPCVSLCVCLCLARRAHSPSLRVVCLLCHLFDLQSI
jgi:hypothetical protein